MKICFKLIKGGSGSDIWAYNFCEILRKKGVEIELQQYPNHFQYCPELLHLYNRRTDADIIHTNTRCGFAFKDSRPMVTTEHLVVHDKSLNEHKSLFQKMFHEFIVFHNEKKTLLKADAVVCVSNYTQRQVKNIFKIDSECILNGIDTELFYPGAETANVFNGYKGKVILFYAGNMTKRKGVDMFPEIMRRLGKNFVLFCATGLRKPAYRGCDNIILLGSLSRKELVDFYCQCDFFLFPTRMEGLSLTVIEAMACGAAVVTTECCSMPELIVDGRGGFLCEKDSVDSFVEKTRILAENRKLAEQMGSFNRERVEKQFTIEKMAESYMSIYRTLLQ